MSPKTVDVIDAVRFVLAVVLIVGSLAGGPAWLILPLLVLVTAGLVWSISGWGGNPRWGERE